jgi:hypothetical protein
LIVRPLTRGLIQPLVQPVAGNRYTSGDTLTAATKALFASGEKGVMFDLSRSANLYTDSARTTLVAATNEQIGSATDLSGNGKHASSAGTTRPKWNEAGYATWDAIDDYLQTEAIDFSSTDAITIVSSIRKGSDAAPGIVCELSSNVSSNDGSFYQLAPATAAGANYKTLSRGTSSSTAQTDGSYAAPNLAVLTSTLKISTDLCALFINGVSAAMSATDQGSGNYGTYALNIGARNATSLFLNGRIYRLLVIGRALTTTERNLAERWAAQPVGITIP